jgi:hypothetical protein
MGSIMDRENQAITQEKSIKQNLLPKTLAMVIQPKQLPRSISFTKKVELESKRKS